MKKLLITLALIPLIAYAAVTITHPSGEVNTFASGSTVNINGAFAGTPTGGTLSLANLTLTIPTLPVAQGGTARTTGTTAYALVATGTTATGAQQTLASGATTEILVGAGAAALPAWTTATGSGAPVRATSPTITGPVIGSGGTAITKHLSATATLDFASTAAGASTDLTITVTGAAVGDTVVLGVPNGSMTPSGSFMAWVSSTNTVGVRFTAVATEDPASGTFRADVWQH